MAETIQRDDDAVRALPARARELQGTPAGIVSRSVAGGIDFAVAGVLLLAIWVGAHGVRFLIRPRSFTWEEFGPLDGVAGYLIVLTVYLAVGWATTGRSLGDHVMGLRVVHTRGGRLHPVVALGRGAFYAVFPLGLLWAAIDARRRSVQDLVLRSTVIYDWTHRVLPKAPPQG